MSTAALPSVSASTAFSPSTSRVRRLRAAATKRRLYGNVQNYEASAKYTEQCNLDPMRVELLIQMVEQLVCQVGSFMGWTTQINYPQSFGTEWAPMHEFSEVPAPTSHQTLPQEEGDNVEKEPESFAESSLLTRCESCWEAFPACCNSHLVHFCQGCSAPVAHKVPVEKMGHPSEQSNLQAHEGLVQEPWQIESQDDEQVRVLLCGACEQVLEDVCGSADACDDCGSPHHPHCLVKVQHPIEPYRLCATCISLRGAGAEIVSSHSSSDGYNDAETERTELLTTVEGRLDYMVKYLELDQQRALTAAVRHSVLQEVRKTMKFKEKKRSAQAFKDKITDLDQFMESLLRRGGT